MLFAVIPKKKIVESLGIFFAGVFLSLLPLAVSFKQDCSRIKRTGAWVAFILCTPIIDLIQFSFYYKLFLQISRKMQPPTIYLFLCLSPPIQSLQNSLI